MSARATAAQRENLDDVGCRWIMGVPLSYIIKASQKVSSSGKALEHGPWTKDR